MPQNPRSISLESAGAKILLKTPWSWACLSGPLCWHLSQPPFHSHKVSMIFWLVLKYKLYFVKLPRWPRGKVRAENHGCIGWMENLTLVWWASNEEKWSRNEHISENIKCRYGHTIGNKNVWAYSLQTLKGKLSLPPLPTLHPQNYLGIIDICEFWKFFSFFNSCTPLKMFFGVGAMISLLSSPRTICWHF